MRGIDWPVGPLGRPCLIAAHLPMSVEDIKVARLDNWCGRFVAQYATRSPLLLYRTGIKIAERCI